MTDDLLPSQLFASAHNMICHGPSECYWCSAPCFSDKWPHGQSAAQPLSGCLRDRPWHRPRRPGNAAVCAGCWLWSRPRVTVCFLGGGFEDIQRAGNWGWLVTAEAAWGLRDDPACWRALASRLLSGGLPRRFLLALPGREPTLLHYCVANQPAEMRADTGLSLTLDNRPYEFSLYEFEEAVTAADSNGFGIGVRTLADFIRPHVDQLELTVEEAPRGRGRPSNEEKEKTSRKRLVHASGNVKVF